MKEFVEMLAQNIVYNDSNLIAISKPWGVGIHKSEVMITKKNSHLLLGVYSGSAKYCINDSLELLSQLLNVKKLKCVKTIDRFMSGIILLVTNETTEKKVIKAINRCKPMEIPFMKFWCITKGWPVINAPFLRERVGIKLLEMDELGEHKESIIIPSEQMTNNMRRRQKPQSDGLIVKTVLSEMRTIEMNKCLSAALVELSTTSLKWNFIPCYLANKAAFVLGINHSFHLIY
jgi:23S rRNA-/tRNA-specific pseudouridylate synthase